MGTGGIQADLTWGFLTVVEEPQLGWLGGYLVLNAQGRPLEFHCTAPVKPNRAQEILYGPTLRPFLFGEQIGGALVKRAKATPWAVCTDQPAVLALREQVECPVALVVNAQPAGVSSAGSETQKHWRVDASHGVSSRLMALAWGANELGIEQRHTADQTLLTERLAKLPAPWDLAEPFARIREALQEAQAGSR